MRRSWRARVGATLVVACAAGGSWASGAAAHGSFTAPVKIAGNAAGQAAAVTPQGDAVITWMEEVYPMASDPASLASALGLPVNDPAIWMSVGRVGGTFSAPELLWSGSCGPPQIASNDRGDMAILWSAGGSAPGSDARLELALRPAGQTQFGPVEDVPVPSSLPGASGWIGGRLAIDASGAVLVVGSANWGNGGQLFSVIRAADGRYGAPQIIGQGSLHTPSLAESADGHAYVVWSAHAPGDAAGQPTHVYVSERVPGAPSFATPSMISDPARDTRSGAAVVVANRRGDVLVVWAGGDAVPGEFPTGVDIAVHPAGSGRFLAPRRLDAGLVSSPVAALSEAGQAAVAWREGTHDKAVFGPVDRFGPPAVVPPILYADAPESVALDPTGATLLFEQSGTLTEHQVNAVVRDGDGPFGPPVTVGSTPPRNAFGTWDRGPVIATDPVGDGVVAWVGGPGHEANLLAASYLIRPPQVSSFAAQRTGTGFRFRLSTPGPVRIDVRAKRSLGSFGRFAHAGVNRVGVPRTLRRRLRRGARYQATIRALGLRAVGRRGLTVRFRAR